MTDLLVFGRSGQVGRELAALPNVTALDRAQADLTDAPRCEAAIREAKPSAVINAAAYTAVDRAEKDEALAMTVNGQAPGVLARVCAELDIPFLHISTDYVFDGSGDRPWKPDDKTGPVNIYGRSKLAGELAVRASGGRVAILRTAWVFSATGTNFVRTMLRLAKTRDTLSVVGDQRGGPTPATDIAIALVRMAAAMHDGAPGGIYHFAGTPASTWVDLARAIFDEAGQSIAITEIPTIAYPTPAARPTNSVLDCSTLKRDFGIAPPDWRVGLRAVLADPRIKL